MSAATRELAQRLTGTLEVVLLWHTHKSNNRNNKRVMLGKCPCKGSVQTAVFLTIHLGLSSVTSAEQSYKSVI